MSPPSSRTCSPGQQRQVSVPEPRAITQTIGGNDVVITLDAGEDPFIRVWRYDRRLDILCVPVWLGSFMARLGAYVEDVDLDPEAERQLLDRLEELLLGTDR